MKLQHLLVIIPLLLTNFSGCLKKDALIVPTCIAEVIKEMESEPVSNPARSVWQYTYRGKVVYFIPSICCDIPSKLLDRDCNLICNPDGGFTGTGDGKCADFFATRTEEKLIWQDKRKQ